MFSSPKDIQSILERFYANLYGPDPIDATVAQAFLDQVQLPRVDPLPLDQLNVPITDMTMTSAMASLASGKAPDPDGYTLEFL